VKRQSDYDRAAIAHSAMHSFWKRLFQRTAVTRDFEPPSSLPIYLFVVFGKKRTRLTSQHLRSLQDDSHQVADAVVEAEVASVYSFYSCLSNFQDEVTGKETDLRVPLLGATHQFPHYISHSHLRQLAREAFEKMQRHFSEGHAWNDQDTMGKYLCPGMGWEVHPDEVGPNVLTPAFFKKLTGYWKVDFECGDDMSPMVDVMEMPWFFKKVAKFAQYSQFFADDERIGVSTKVLGLTFPTVSYYTREGRLTQRRDMRKGISRVSLVPTTFGFRQYVQWGQPYAGFAVIEGQLSPDLNAFETLTLTQRYDGPHCCLRSVFRRMI